MTWTAGTFWSRARRGGGVGRAAGVSARRAGARPAPETPGRTAPEAPGRTAPEAPGRTVPQVPVSLRAASTKRAGRRTPDRSWSRAAWRSGRAASRDGLAVRGLRGFKGSRRSRRSRQRSVRSRASSPPSASHWRAASSRPASRSRRPGAIAQARKLSASRPGSRRRRPRSSRKNLARSNSGNPMSARSEVPVVLMLLKVLMMLELVVLEVLMVLELELVVKVLVALGLELVAKVLVELVVAAGVRADGVCSPDGRNTLGW